MGRKKMLKENKKVKVSLSIDPFVMKRVDDILKMKRMKFKTSKFVENALIEYLEKYDN